jgi:flagellar hook protein FlgE
MSSALTSALSGLRAHQFYLDVIGNNLANSSTVAYHSSRVTFADVLAQTFTNGSAPTSTIGGVNPMQVGLGVQIHSVDIRNEQGALTSTGRPFDLAIQGAGFFVLNNGTKNVYSRAGGFGIDKDNFLVDPGTGYRVRSATGQDIQLPVNTLLPAKETSTIHLGGNLPAKVGGPVAEVLTSSTAYEGGTHAVVTGSATGPYALADGDTLDVTIDGGLTQTVTFHAADFTALGSNILTASATDVATVMQAQVAGATVSGASGSIVVTSDRTGENAAVKIDDGTGSPAAILGLSTTLVSGVSSPALGTTPLNDLADNLVDYQNGDRILVSGTNAAGQSFAGTFVYGTDGTTLGELKDFADNLVSDASVSLDASGNMVVTADATGAAALTMSISDDVGNVGQSTFSAHGFAITTPGTDADQARTSLDVFDTRGLSHTVTLTFTRGDASQWNVAATTDDPNDQIIDGVVQDVRFNPDGSFASVNGVGAGDANLQITFAGLTASQSIALDLGTSGKLDGVTQLGESTSLSALSQDGYATGELVSMSVNSDGTIVGSYSNGQNQDLNQIAVAVFSNPGGLERVGDTMFEESTNSGAAQLQAATGGRPGSIVGGALEASNVDVAEEFVRLIEAQRGFEANARVIRVSDQLLQDLVQII